MKKRTGMIVACFCAIPLGILSAYTHQLAIYLIIGVLLGWAAAIYDCR